MLIFTRVWKPVSPRNDAMSKPYRAESECMTCHCHSAEQCIYRGFQRCVNSQWPTGGCERNRNKNFSIVCLFFLLFSFNNSYAESRIVVFARVTVIISTSCKYWHERPQQPTGKSSRFGFVHIVGTNKDPRLLYYPLYKWAGVTIRRLVWKYTKNDNKLLQRSWTKGSLLLS